MSVDKQETQEFMKAYNGLKSAANALEEMARQQEPDLDKMLMGTKIKRAKEYYDKCSSVIEGIGSGRTLLGQLDNMQGEGWRPRR